ncbi:MAG: DapH/DapD/GlmU-related protein, partial [Mycobacteriales bacterium]
QIGRNVHLSGGVGIGGVLEPPQAAPVVVEDDVFVGSRSMIVDGARVHPGAKLGAGSILTASTHVVDANSGEEYPRGEVPARAVCVGSTRVKSFPGGDFGMPILLVLRVLEPGEQHDKLVLNDVLREHGVAP